jgi:hypothetical protein
MSSELKIEDAWHSPDLHIYQAVEAMGMFRYRFEFSRLRSSGSALHSEVVVYMDIDGMKEGPPPTRRVLGPMSINLLAGTWMKSNGLVGMLDSLQEDLDWLTLLQDIIPTTIDKQRGLLDVASNLTWEQDEEAQPYLIQPFVAASGVTVLFGPGGTGKSTLAAALALTVMSGESILGDFVNDTGPVLWIDYEADMNEPFMREAAFRRFLGMEIAEHQMRYIKPAAKFIDSLSVIRREIHEVKPKMVVLDSIANARRGDANTAEDTVALFSVMGQLGVPVLAIDHMSAEAAAKQDMTKPYGSVFTTNGARMTWGVLPNETASTEESKFLNMAMAKVNVVAGKIERGVRLNYWSYDTGLVKALQAEQVAPKWQKEETTTESKLLRVLGRYENEYLEVGVAAKEAEVAASSAARVLGELFDDSEVVRKKLGGRGDPWGYKIAGTR